MARNRDCPDNRSRSSFKRFRCSYSNSVCSLSLGSRRSLRQLKPACRLPHLTVGPGLGYLINFQRAQTTRNGQYSLRTNKESLKTQLLQKNCMFFSHNIALTDLKKSS